MGLVKNDKGQIIRNKDVDLDKNKFFSYQDDEVEQGYPEEPKHYGSMKIKDVQSKLDTRAPIARGADLVQKRLNNAPHAKVSGFGKSEDQPKATQIMRGNLGV